MSVIIIIIILQRAGTQLLKAGLIVNISGHGILYHPTLYYNISLHPNNTLLKEMQNSMAHLILSISLEL